MHESLDEVAIGLDHEPTAALEREWQGLPQPFLSEVRVVSDERIARELSQVLPLQVSVACALEPIECLHGDPLGLVDVAEVVLVEAEHRRRPGLVAMTSPLARKLDGDGPPGLRL